MIRSSLKLREKQESDLPIDSPGATGPTGRHAVTGCTGYQGPTGSEGPTGRHAIVGSGFSCNEYNKSERITLEKLAKITPAKYGNKATIIKSHNNKWYLEATIFPNDEDKNAKTAKEISGKFSFNIFDSAIFVRYINGVWYAEPQLSASKQPANESSDGGGG